MSPWPAAVAAEPKTLHMLLDADARLAAAAGGVARFLADEAGLETGAAARLQLAVIEACKHEFKFLAVNHSHLEITFARFRNRLEVALSHEVDSPSTAGAVPGERLAGQKPESGNDSAALVGFDRVQHETHGKEIVTRLTKYFA